MGEAFPRVRGLLLAEVLDALPARLRRKIEAAGAVDEADPGHATGVGTFVVRQGGGTVTFTADEITTLQEVGCDCLLAPRCLHLAQALLRCEVTGAAAPADRGAPDGPYDASGADPGPGKDEAPGLLLPGQLEVLERALAAFAGLLAAGTSARDTLQYSGFLRLAHEARTHRMYALGTGCAAVAALLPAAGSTARNTVVSTVADGYLAAHRLEHRHGTGSLGAADLGVPRWSFSARDSLSLQGVFSEPVLAAGGYAGVATHLRDGQGVLWSVNSIMPLAGADSPAAQARQHYRRAPRIGGISTSHRELARRTLLVTNVQASDDGRLGAGARVAAVAGVPAAWDPGWFEGNGDPAGNIHYRNLVVTGMSGTSLALETAEGHTLVVQPTPAARELGALDDFLELARRPGLRLRCVLRRTFDALHLLAFAVDPGQVLLPDSWQDRVMVGLDRLAPTHFRMAGGWAPQVPPVGGGPWTLLAQWLGRVAVHGRAGIVNDRTQLAADVSRLRNSQCPHGAQLLLDLQEAAHRTRREFDGSLRPLDVPLARAWLALAAFARAWQEHAGPR